MHVSVWGWRIQRTALLLSLLLLATLLLPIATARAQESGKIVRVGWYDSQFNVMDELGRRSGYAYDYQQKIAAYTGWSYEYVEGSWSDLLQMLQDGKIDLLSDVSYTDERAEHMLYSSLPMGAEEYYLFATPGNEEITPEDYSTFNGKKVGANKGSIQIGYFREWAANNGVQAEIVELTGKEEDNLEALAQGKIDLYLSLDGFFDKGSAMPVCRVGASDFYFVVSKSHPDLLAELNSAMNRVQDENRYYNQQLYAKYLQTSSVNSYLNANERTWLADHGPIRVGYQDNYLAFCAKDPATGELTGALKDCLNAASEGIENTKLEFEPVCYPTSAAAMEAMKAGEVDCVFPVNLTDYDGEVKDVFITPALMRTDMSAVIRETDKRSFASKERITVAVNTDNPNYDMFLLDHFPEWRAIYFSDTQACLEAVADGRADCLLISHYRYNNISGFCEKHGLTTWSTGVELDYCLAVRRQDTTLYSILSKATGTVPPSTVGAALTKYYTDETGGNGTADFVNQVLPSIAAFVPIVIALVVLFVLLRGVWLDRKGGGKRQRIPVKEDFALFDDMPISCSVYHVTHTEHSELYDAEIIYVNRRFLEFGEITKEAVLGHHVREMYPYIGEEWFEYAKRAALGGETIESEYTDPLSGHKFQFKIWQVVGPEYCAATYREA